MKNFRFFTKSLIFVLILSALALAQTEKLPAAVGSKIAVINTEAFYDREKGIKELVETNDKLEAEFKLQKDELNLMAEKLKKLEKELRDFSGLIEPPRNLTKEMINNKINEYDLTGDKFKKKRDEIKILFEKRDSETVGLVRKKVGEAIKRFAKDNGHVLVLDSSKDNSSAIIEGETIDITKVFIRYYNEDYSMRNKL
jgi:Skp family chaperone for outer membrane proteins